MGIFRGLGGTGESSSDSTIAATTALANAAAASATAALASENSAETAETNAASSASAASTSASNASSSASNASSSASAASTSATNAASSASSASSSASTATTKASEASTSATNAAASASAASTSATNAASSASTASTAATTATTKASEASTSASNAATSATNAAASATSAAAVYDAFDDRFLGAKTTNPTVDNDGDALLSGALYWNSLSNEMRVYNGSTWQAIAALPDSVVERTFLATAGQTSYTFSGNYRVGFVYPFVNGSLLYTSDYTATNGSTITFASALALNDEVRIITFKAAGSTSRVDVNILYGGADLKSFCYFLRG